MRAIRRAAANAEEEEPAAALAQVGEERGRTLDGVEVEAAEDLRRFAEVLFDEFGHRVAWAHAVRPYRSCQ